MVGVNLQHRDSGSVLFRVESAVAARDDERLAGDPGRIRRSEKDGRAGDVTRLTYPAKWGLCFDALLHFASGNTCRMDAFRLHHARIDRVDANLPRSQFGGQRARY